MSSGCRRCGKPAYVKPDGSDAALCVDCIMAEFEKLEIFPKEKAVEQSRALDGATGICKCGYMAIYPICTKCGRAYPPRQ